MAPRIRFLFRILAALALAVGPATAHIRADMVPHDGCSAPAADQAAAPATLPTPAQVVDLVTWIGTATDYDVSATLADPPAVGFCTVGEVIDYEDDLIAVPGDMRGAYDLSATRIVLVRPWNAAKQRDLSVLLHELVHHVQLQNRRYECLQAPEWEAYKLQDAWLAEHGIESGFDWFQIYMASRCPRDHHP